jgi:hypothetical protein
MTFIPEIIFGGIIAVILLREGIMAAVNYHYWWEKWRRRLEPITNELKRRAKVWWWAETIDAVLIVGGLVGMLLFTQLTYPLWAKILIIVITVLATAFYVWLIFHLGGYARRLFRWITS